MGLFGTVAKAIGAVVLILVGLGAYLYFTDYGAEASVTDRSARCPPGEIVVTPRILPSYDHATALDCDTWQFVCVGYDVTFHLQSKEYVVRDEQGRVVVDSRTDRTDTVGLLRCGASNLV